VRVVHSWFASTDDWDNQFEAHEYGWAAFFRILRLYLAHFRGQPSAAFQLMGAAAEPTTEAWAAPAGPRGPARAAAGPRATTPAAGARRWPGVVDGAGPAEYPELLLRLDEPAPALAHLFAPPMGGQVYLPIRLFLYGDRAPAAVARAEPLWQAWVGEHLPVGG